MYGAIKKDQEGKTDMFIIFYNNIEENSAFHIRKHSYRQDFLLGHQY